MMYLLELVVSDGAPDHSAARLLRSNQCIHATYGVAFAYWLATIARNCSPSLSQAAQHSHRRLAYTFISTSNCTKKNTLHTKVYPTEHYSRWLWPVFKPFYPVSLAYPHQLLSRPTRTRKPNYCPLISLAQSHKLPTT
jgi:hypothetical protein